MTLPTDQDPPRVNPADDFPADDTAQIAKGEQRNLTVLAVHQILLRVGWLFKAETVVMPAFLDSLVAAGWIRGILPLFNRLGQGLSQLVFAGFLSRLHKKTTALAVITLIMAFPLRLIGFPFLGRVSSKPVWRDLAFPWNLSPFLSGHRALSTNLWNRSRKTDPTESTWKTAFDFLVLGLDPGDRVFALVDAALDRSNTNRLRRHVRLRREFIPAFGRLALVLLGTFTTKLNRR